MKSYDKIAAALNEIEKTKKKDDIELVKVCIRIPKKTLINLKRKKLDAEEHNKYLSVQDQIIEALEDYLNKK